jgi:hypothetical protein
MLSQAVSRNTPTTTNQTGRPRLPAISEAWFDGIEPGFIISFAITCRQLVVWPVILAVV